MREQQIQKSLMDRLEREGHYCVKVVCASRAGAPDVITCQNGRFVAYECKTKGGKISPLQKYNHDKISRSGGEIIIYRGDKS